MFLFESLFYTLKMVHNSISNSCWYLYIFPSYYHLMYYSYIKKSLAFMCTCLAPLHFQFVLSLPAVKVEQGMPCSYKYIWASDPCYAWASNFSLSLFILQSLARGAILKEGVSHHVNTLKYRCHSEFNSFCKLSTMASRAQEPLCKCVNRVLFRCGHECRQIKRS